MISRLDPDDVLKYIRINMDPNLLRQKKPAVIVRQAGSQRHDPLCRRVVIKCSCGNEVAGVVQEKNTPRAYVVVTESSIIEKYEE